MHKITLSEKLLTFIAYSLPKLKFKLSYPQLQKMLEKYWGVQYQISTLRKEFSVLKKQKLIARRSRYNRQVPVLSAEGKLKISSQLPYKKFGHFDGRWRVVMFEIPDKYRQDRQILKEKLQELGFEKIQKGVYISPHPLFGPLRRFATDLGIRQYLTLLEVDKIDREEKEIQDIWEISEINEKYQKFIKEVQSSRFAVANRGSSMAKPSGQKSKVKSNVYWPLLAKQLEQKFSQIYQQDPHLPEEFLPKDWQGEKAYKLYKTIVNSY